MLDMYRLGAIRRDSTINESKIDNFISQIKNAKSDAEELERPFFTRIICISLLDTLSHCAFPNLRENRTRFVRLIDDYAQWDLTYTFSLRQLSLRLADVTNPSSYPGYQALAENIQERMQTWPGPGEIVFAKDIDPTLSDLSSLLSNKLEDFIEPIRYPSLLWKLRNYVIHEGRNPGEGIDLELGDTSPYYHYLTHMDRIGEITQTWELYFSNNLISSILTKCVNNLSKKLRKDDIDPWLAFPYNSKWY